VTRVAVVGASGFVGGAVADALERRGADAVPVVAPRVTSGASSVADLVRELEAPRVAEATARLRRELAGCAAVVNAAGVAGATRGPTPELLGANALLPLVVAEARPSDARLVHVSTAAVQGRRAVLDESMELAPFSPYSWSKALAEQALVGRSQVVVYRPTSVHGPGRDVTTALARMLSSPLASVAGLGDRATPQVLVSNVADGIAFVSMCEEAPPPVVLHPAEGLTAAELVRRVGGREPRHLPESLARAVVRGGAWLGRHQAAVAGSTRRLEMMWFGQEQAEGWLDGRWTAPVGLAAWEEVR
jgi:UDP-glucose 4-epimerase